MSTWIRFNKLFSFNKHTHPMSSKVHLARLSTVLNAWPGFHSSSWSVCSDVFIEWSISLDEVIESVVNEQCAWLFDQLPLDGIDKQFTEQAAQRYKNLQKWIEIELEKWDIEKPKYHVAIVDDKYGNGGLIAKEHLKKGEIFLMLPRQMIMTARKTLKYKNQKIVQDTKETHSILRIVEQIEKQQQPSLACALRLWYEKVVKTHTSYWKEYIEALPKKTGVPFMRKTKKLKEELQASETLRQIIEIKRTVAKQYVEVMKIVKKERREWGAIFRYEEFAWCCATVMARQNQIPIKNETAKEIALMPGFDMVNHCSDGFLTANFDVQKNALMVHTIHPVAANQEIRLFYGPRPNSELFVWAGFVDSSNRFDFVKLELHMPQHADADLLKIRSLMLAKSKMMQQFQLRLPLPLPPKMWAELRDCADIEARKLRSSEKAISDAFVEEEEEFYGKQREAEETSNHLQWYKMMHWLRLAVLQKDDAAAALKQQTNSMISGIIDFPISRKNEPAAFNFLRTQLLLHLAQYPTTHDDDLFLLSQVDAQKNLTEQQHSMICCEDADFCIHAVRLRCIEKRLYGEALRLVSSWCASPPTFVVESLG